MLRSVWTRESAGARRALSRAARWPMDLELDLEIVQDHGAARNDRVVDTVQAVGGRSVHRRPPPADDLVQTADVVVVVVGGSVILFDPIFQGLAISLMMGSLLSTVLTVVVIPLAYYLYKLRTTHGASR